MSRTDAHVPLYIRVARRDVPRAEVHDHADGVCDLPDPYSWDALWQGRGHCHWTWLRDGHGLCPCGLPPGGGPDRRERRGHRQRTRRELRDTVLRWNTSGEA